MTNKHNKRVHDVEGREMLSKICNGSGLDIGSGGRPISDNSITVDNNTDMHPDIVADMCRVPVEDNSQDFVVASHVLEHTDRILDALKEWYRVLKQNGKIGIMVPHGEFVGYEDLGDSELQHKSLLTEKTLELYLKHVGFKEVNSNRLERPLANNEAPAVIAFATK